MHISKHCLFNFIAVLLTYNICSAQAGNERQFTETHILFNSTNTPSQEWITLGNSPLRLETGPLLFQGEDIKIESASLSLYYRYEPDWTDVVMRLNIESLDSKRINSVDWYGAIHPNKTLYGKWYEFPIPKEMIENWVARNGTPGFILSREYIMGGKNPNHPLVFGAPGATDKVRPILKVRYSFSGNAPPTSPYFTMDIPPNPVKGHVNVTWAHKEPRDINAGDIVTYQLESALADGPWIKQGDVSTDRRQYPVSVPAAPPGTALRVRLRAIDNKGVASDWVDSSPPYQIGGEETTAYQVFLDSPLKKIKRFDTVHKPSSRVNFFAARGEAECIQLVMTGATTLEDLVVYLDSFIGPDGARIPPDRISIYRQEYLNITTPSKNVGQTGWWPDALVPLKDRYFGETRARRPMTKNGGENESFWIEVETPQGQKPGLYRSTVHVETKQLGKQEIPLEFSVRQFSIPVRSTVRTSFGCDPTSLTDSFGAYKQEALRHRISLSGGYFTIMGTYDAATDTCRINGGQAERFYQDAMTGHGMPDGRAFDSINVSGKPDVNTDQAWVAYWRGVQHYLEKKGWLEQAFAYVKDEPRDQDIPAVALKSRQIKAGAPKLRTLVTSEYRPELQGVIDIWCPVINYYDNTKRHGGEVFYRERQKLGEQVWWYTSMMSEDSRSLPSYFIDASAVSPRVVGWLTWLRGVQGILYYHMSYSWKNLPWVNQYAFGANGDGTLWYPGTPDAIGGSNTTPVPSIRLKSIRDGLEDFEYLALLEKLGGKSEADKICRLVGDGPLNWRDDPETMARAREMLANTIERLGGDPM